MKFPRNVFLYLVLVLAALAIPFTIISNVSADGSEVEPVEIADEEDIEEIDAGEIEVEGGKPADKENLPGEDFLIVEFTDFAGALRGIGSELDLIGALDASFIGSALDITTISIRGASPHRSAVLLGGVPLSSETIGAFDFSMLPAGTIGGAKITRGPGAVSKGMAGEIDLWLRRPGSAELSVSSGSFGTYSVRAAAPLGFASESFIALSHEETDGDFSYRRHDGERYTRENNARRKSSLALAMREVFENGETRLALIAADKSGGVPGLAEFPSPEARQTDTLVALGAARERRITSDSDIEFSGFIRTSHTGFDDPSPFLGGAIQTDQTEYAAGAAVRYRAFGGGGITGAKLALDAAKLDDAAYGNPSRTQAALTLWREFYFGASALSAAVTLDASTDGDAGWRAKVAAEYALGGGWSLAGSAARTFRRPNFSELYYPASGFIAGNPDLQNETGYGFDFGPHYSKGSFGFSIVGFSMRFADSIQFVPVTQYRIRAENTGALRNAGISADAGLTLNDGAKIKASFTFLDAVYLDGGLKQAGRPSRKFAIGLDKDFGDANLRLTYLYTSAMPVDRFGNIYVGASGELSALLRVNIGRSLSVSAACFNILNGDLRDSLDFPRPGRSFEFAVNCSF